MVSIVIVNWNVRDLLRQCLESIDSHVRKAGDEVEVIVVDNNSSDGSADFVTKFFPWVKLIRNTDNLGFGVACNMGSKIATGEYIYFINPDVRLDTNSIKPLLQFLAQQPNVGLVAPQIKNDNGTTQHSVRQFVSPLIMFLLISKLALLLSWTKLWQRYMCTNFSHQQFRSVDQVMGAAMFMRTTDFHDFGGFDPNFFIWFEEVDLCLRIKQAGKLIIFNPQAVVWHSKSRSFTQVSMLTRLRYFNNSALYYAKKHFSTSAYIAVWLMSYLTLMLVLLVNPWQNFVKKYQATER